MVHAAHGSVQSRSHKNTSVFNRKVLLAAAIACATQATMVQAAGYGINEQSASYLGTAFAGRGSNAIDAAVQSSNPAAISFLEGGAQMSVGTDVILEGGKFEGEYTGYQTSRPVNPSNGSGAASGKTEDFQSTAVVPFGYLVMPINDKLSFGLAGYAPYGIELDYDSDWAGSYWADETSVKVINLQGTFAYKITDDFSVGLGLIGSYVDGRLTQKSWLDSTGTTPLNADAVIEGDDTTFAWNLGAVWNVSDATTLGLAYHSKLDFTLEGDFNLKNIRVGDTPAGQPNQKFDASLDMVMPEKVMFSVTHKMDDRWTVMSDVTWTRWSQFEEFNVVTNVDGVGSYIPMNWKNTWAVSVGTSYQLNDEWLLRGGYMFDESPVRNDTRTARSPDANRNWFTLGANWKTAENMSVDLAYAYVKLNDGSMSETKHYEDENQSGEYYGTLTGDFESASHIVGVQLNYIF